MSSHMVCQVALGCKGLGATFNVASERLLSRMNSQVGLQVSFLGKGLIATFDRALKRFLASLPSFIKYYNYYMGPNVDLKPPRPRVAFTAVVACKGFVSRVNQLVRFEVALSYELLSAALETTDEWSLPSLHEL